MDRNGSECIHRDQVTEQFSDTNSITVNTFPVQASLKCMAYYISKSYISYYLLTASINVKSRDSLGVRKHICVKVAKTLTFLCSKIGP